MAGREGERGGQTLNCRCRVFGRLSAEFDGILGYLLSRNLAISSSRTNTKGVATYLPSIWRPQHLLESIKVAQSESVGGPLGDRRDLNSAERGKFGRQIN